MEIAGGCPFGWHVLLDVGRKWWRPMLDVGVGVDIGVATPGELLEKQVLVYGHGYILAWSFDRIQIAVPSIRTRRIATHGSLDISPWKRRCVPAEALQHPPQKHCFPEHWRKNRVQEPELLLRNCANPHGEQQQ